MKTKTTPKPKMVTTTIWIESVQLEELKAMAQEETSSVSLLVRKALRQYLKPKNKKR